MRFLFLSLFLLSTSTMHVLSTEARAAAPDLPDQLCSVADDSDPGLHASSADQPDRELAAATHEGAPVMAKITVRTKGATKHFSRAGRTFGQEPTEIDTAALTPEQLEQLRVEGLDGGMLIVTGLERVPTPQPSAPAPNPTATTSPITPPPTPAAVPHATGVDHSSPSKSEMATGGGKESAAEGGDASGAGHAAAVAQVTADGRKARK